MATASPDLIAPDELADMMESPDFAALPAFERAQMFDAGLEESRAWLKTNAGDDEKMSQAFDETASAMARRYRPAESDIELSKQGVLATAGNAFARDLGGVALDTVGGVAKGAAETKRALGPAGEALRLMPGMSTVMSLGGAGDAVAGFTDAVRERGRDVYPTNPANPVADTIGGGAGQAVAMLGTMGAAAPVMGTGAALTVVPSVLGGTMGLGSGIDTAKDMGIDNPAGRLALGAAFGGAEAITERLGGIGGKAAAKALQQGVRAGLKQAGKSVLSEAIEEPISGTLQDAATFTAGQFVADPNRPGYTTNGTKLPALDAEFLKRRKLEAIGGAAGGVVFGGLQMVGTQAGRGEEGKRGAGEPGPPPLPVREDLGELTAEDVADLEEATAEDSSTVQARAPILTNVPDRVEPTTFQSGPGTTDAEPGSSASSVPAPVADVIETAPSPGTVADASVLPAAESPVEAVGTPVPVVGELPTATAPVAEFDLFGEAADPEPATSYMDQIETSEVPITQLSLSSDVPQFKDGANAQGVVEPLEGKYQRLGTGPILVWERTNGKREVISGRHRFDLAKRTGEKTIPAQVVREADGFTLQHAITADAELNIRDGQGKAKDYANYFRNSQQSGRTRAEAEAGGLLSRALGRSGWTIGTQASAEVFDLHANDKLSTQAAEALARTAPNNEALQRVGAQSILDGQPIDVSVNLMRALQSELGGVGTTDQLDLFGSNDSAMQAMKQQAKRATEIQRGLREQISAVQGAAKRPDQAAKLGVNVKDPASILKRVESLKGELLRWESWPMHTDLREQVRGEQRVPTAAATAPADLGLLLEGTESTRPMNRGETATPQAADPLAELGNAKRAGEAEQAQGKMGFKNLDTSGKTAGFVNGDILSEAADLIRSGITDFAAWSKSMVTRFGQAIRQYLQGIWEQVSAALPTDASKNVRLGSSAKAASVGLAQGGFVMGPNRVEETKARFARPEQQERLYQVREDVTVKAAAEAWVDSLPMAEAVAAMEAGRLPADMTGDVAQHAAGLLIQRTTEMMKSNQEVVQMQARSLGQRISKVWQGWLSQEAGRNLRQRSVVSSELTPYAPILAAEGMLIDRADAVMEKRYEGGAEGAVKKVKETADKAGGEASTELTQDLEADTPVTGESSVAREMREARKARALKKHPSLKRMLDALRKKLYPGMKWADIFMDLPSAQKDRQREIYRRLMLDERLKGLSKDERLALTNELDKAWQQERRKVFLRELERVGIGEKAAADKAKVVKALPKLIRLINLGMMNSEMFREAVAPEYGLKQITTGQALALRKLAEEAYALPEGVLRSRKLAALLDGIQKSTGTGLPEVLNQYWVSAVLSGMRTQFDTFMSLTNGFGNQLIQSGMLAIKNGNRAAAMVSMLEWWRGLKQAFPEAMQILSKGDYSYLKRFNDDLRKALEGETTFRPVPLGEALWRDGNAMEKYGFAPVMIWTGRLMAAADHLNNSATTAGAKVVARALHPELYKTVSASQSEREAAAAQARREVTGGAMPATAPERATVAARTREILNGQLRPEEVKEAAFMGDQAAYQNDPTGVFGGIYRAVNQGLGTLERGLQAYADEKGTDGPAGQYARGLMLFFSGAMRSMMGAKFIRFGANFGNDMLGYVPGTVLVSPALLGAEATRSQKQLLLGKNVFGLMAGLTVAAMFLGKDDEEDGWHLEGPWSDLTPEEVKQRRAAGFESLTFWKRTADKVERVSYKQWPTAGLLAGVAHMQDRQRFRPEKWAKEGMAGHLLAAATVGAFQVKDVSAMRGLADLLGASKFGTNPEEAFVEKMAKMPINFAGGFIPTLAKDLDALADSRRYKPETVMEEFLRNVPLARRAVAGGRPEINILGVAIEQDRKPWSRAYTDAESGPAHAVLGSLSARGFTLPTPETNRKVWKDGAWSTIAAMGADAEWRYQKKVGEGYRAWLGSSEGRALLTMPDGLAVQKLINRQADTIKRQALQAVMK